MINTPKPYERDENEWEAAWEKSRIIAVLITEVLLIAAGIGCALYVTGDSCQCKKYMKRAQ